MDDQRGMLEVHAPAPRELDSATDLTLDLRRREREAFVGASGADAERIRMLPLEIAEDGRRQLGEIKGAPPRTREIRDPENAAEPITGLVP